MKERRQGMSHRTPQQRGASRLTILVFFALFAMVVYVGYRIIPFYYCYFEMQNQMQQVIRIAGSHSDQEIRRKLMYHMKKLDIPAEPEALKIERDGEFMRIRLQYQEILYFTFRGKDHDLYTFDFDAYAEGGF